MKNIKKKRKCKRSLNKKVQKKSKKRWLMGKGEDVINEKINEKEEEYEEYVDSLSELQTATGRAQEIKEEDVQSNIMDWSGYYYCIHYTCIFMSLGDILFILMKYTPKNILYFPLFQFKLLTSFLLSDLSMWEQFPIICA